MNKHYEAIANIIGGVLWNSTKLTAVVDTLIKYFKSEDNDFNIEEFRRITLNGDFQKTNDEKASTTIVRVQDP